MDVHIDSKINDSGGSKFTFHCSLHKYVKFRHENMFLTKVLKFIKLDKCIALIMTQYNSRNYLCE